MMGRVRKVWLLVGLLAVSVAAGGMFALWRPRVPEERFPLPEYSATPYLNARADVRYVGSNACVGCHRARHASYLLTAHSRALADLDPALEPADGQFEHKATGRSYRVYRAEGQLRHEEILRTKDGKEIGRVDMPIRYRIGSGSFCRTYLVEIDGFLHESPITYYTARKQWDVSPGYDFPQHWGFERPILGACVACHAGHAEPVGGTTHRHTLNEQAIGCESCHGPGALHVERRQGSSTPDAGEDRTIVNPGKLSRPLLEAVCGRCHLNGPASVLLRGRQGNDYRPGMPLSDVRTDYRLDAGNEQMTVVGHMEQLRRSACYQKSPELSCLTCHDPHEREQPKDAVAFYRGKCLNCHATQGCRLEPAERSKQAPADNCMTCHMPRGDTDIPHIAFTHHRIGRHGPAAKGTVLDRVPELVPTDDVRHLPLLDQKRNLGLAYVMAARDPTNARFATVFRQRAVELLDSVQAAGLHDPGVAAALAELFFERDRWRAAEYARQVLDAKDAPAEMRATALLVAGSAAMQDGDFTGAGRYLEELTRLRRFADDWRLFGMSWYERGEPDRALPALRQALALRPFRASIHADLATVLGVKGDAAQAKEHLDKARWLFANRQD